MIYFKKGSDAEPKPTLTEVPSVWSLESLSSLSGSVEARKGRGRGRGVKAPVCDT